MCTIKWQYRKTGNHSKFIDETDGFYWMPIFMETWWSFWRFHRCKVVRLVPNNCFVNLIFLFSYACTKSHVMYTESLSGYISEPGFSLARGIMCWWVCLYVFLSVTCPRMQRPEKPKIGTVEAHHTSNLWAYLEVKRSNIKVTKCKSIAAASRYVHVHICGGSLKELPRCNSIGCCSVAGNFCDTKVKVKPYSNSIIRNNKTICRSRA